MLVITLGKKTPQKIWKLANFFYVHKQFRLLTYLCNPHRMTKVSRRRSSLEFNKKYTIVNEQNTRTFIPVPIQKHLKTQAQAKKILSFLSIDLIRSEIA